VIYDQTTHAEKEIIDAPCPGLDAITKDEQGNLYFSNWEYPALHALVGTGAAPCVTRLTALGGLDADWQSDLSTLTDGRPVMNFQYLKDGKGIAAVLHSELFGDDFDFEALTDPTTFGDSYGVNYRLWMFDFKAGSAEPIRGLPEGDVPPSYVHNQADGRDFLMVEVRHSVSHVTRGPIPGTFVYSHSAVVSLPARLKDSPWPDQKDCRARNATTNEPTPVRNSAATLRSSSQAPEPPQPTMIIPSGQAVLPCSTSSPDRAMASAGASLAPTPDLSRSTSSV